MERRPFAYAGPPTRRQFLRVTASVAGSIAAMSLSACGAPCRARAIGRPVWPDGYTTGYPSSCSFDAPLVQTSFTYFTDLLIKDHVSPTNDDVKAMALPKAPFIEQRVAMDMVGGWYIENLKGTVKFRMGVAAYPRAVTNKAAIWPDAFVIAAETKYPDQTWTVLKYLTGAEGIQGYVDTTGAAPANVQFLDRWYALYTPLVPAAELKQAVEGSLTQAVVPIVKAFVDFPHLDQVLQPVLQSMWQGKVPVLTAMQQAQRAETAALAPNAGKKLCSAGTSFDVCQS